ncbi:MAG: NfeD family protein [Thermoplasmatota archaeon]
MDITFGLILIAVGIALFIFEAAEPGFFIAIPGGVLVVLGVMAVAYPNLLVSIWTPIILAIVVIPLMILSMKIYQKMSPPTKPTTTMGTSLVGQKAKVMQKIKPDEISGKIKVNNQLWSATADEEIPEGALVQIIESKGVHVKVRRIE